MIEKLCFIKSIGKENDGFYRYEFMFLNNIDEFQLEEDNYPCCLAETIVPITNTTIHVVKTKIKLDLIQDNCCFSFKHAIIGIVALGWEDISSYDEYPEDGRIFFKFGESLEEVENKLAMKNILMLD